MPNDLPNYNPNRFYSDRPDVKLGSPGFIPEAPDNRDADNVYWWCTQALIYSRRGMESILAEYSFRYADKFKCTKGDDGKMIADIVLLNHSKPMWYFPQMVLQELGERKTGVRVDGGVDDAKAHARGKLYDTMHTLFSYRPGRLADAVDRGLRRYFTGFGAVVYMKPDGSPWGPPVV
eukprot:GHVU01083661.1.p1 GENE.GHVU01083661.1~~GHVU01083661.1.p1  ORF type:complete len:177 (+),score=6.70 GHVU01083661.1:2-532(+)